jgi:predicted DCC family thiol-disulfide oxidoreductase YuxK
MQNIPSKKDFIFAVRADFRLSEEANPILLYDGVCGFCNQAVQFVLRHDREGVFRFAALQSAFARAILAKYRIDPSELNTIYVVLRNGDGSERLLSRSDAALYIADRLKMKSRFLRLFPRFLRNWAYNIVARFRYRIWGKYDTCMVPQPGVRARFLE